MIGESKIIGNNEPLRLYNDADRGYYLDRTGKKYEFGNYFRARVAECHQKYDFQILLGSGLILIYTINAELNGTRAAINDAINRGNDYWGFAKRPLTTEPDHYCLVPV